MPGKPKWSDFYESLTDLRHRLGDVRGKHWPPKERQETTDVAYDLDDVPGEEHDNFLARSTITVVEYSEWEGIRQALLRKDIDRRVKWALNRIQYKEPNGVDTKTPFGPIRDSFQRRVDAIDSMLNSRQRDAHKSRQRDIQRTCKVARLEMNVNLAGILLRLYVLEEEPDSQYYALSRQAM
ncbi:hypothetical protein OOZ51_00395 [Arthrobacter sp. MI7-26]|uniref:hypothetical protein n=1 Tax=Arthrobacter sp. MI7-26 TaxID=2993653 RepID=UPI002248D3EE|nr:hypothetical protein [Arthrobacter sp. MI7-26]MCX2746272.1 hypothetical protein [Arthrobacter sp. MI7-26]